MKVQLFIVLLNSNITFAEVTSKTQSTTRRQDAPLARMLSFVLLFLVAYGATVETAHRHDNLALDAARSQINAKTIGEPVNSDSPLTNSSATDECLICQLHQHLFTSLTNALPAQHVQQFASVRIAAAAFTFYSRPNTPGHGRAPPTFLL